MVFFMFYFQKIKNVLKHFYTVWCTVDISINSFLGGIMLKLLFEYLTSPYTLVENPLHDCILLSVLGTIAFVISFRIVGCMYDSYLIEGSGAGSFFHWMIRFFVFVILHSIVATAIKLYVWLPNPCICL